MLRKPFAGGIILLFLLSSIIPMVSSDTSTFNKTNKQSMDHPLIDIYPPYPDGENGWYITQPKASIKWGIQGVILYRIDNGSWVTYGEPFTIDWTDGYHTFEARLINSTGEIYDIIEFKLDTTPPFITVFRDLLFPLIMETTTNTHNETSGINRVEFYIQNELKHVDFEEPYEWIVNK